MVTRVNPLQMAAKTYETKRKCMVTPAKKRWSYGKALHYGLSMLIWEKMYGNACCNALTRLLYGNVLHYGLSMFVRLKKLPYPSAIPILVRLSMLPDITELFVKI